MTCDVDTDADGCDVCVSLPDKFVCGRCYIAGDKPLPSDAGHGDGR